MGVAARALHSPARWIDGAESSASWRTFARGSQARVTKGWLSLSACRRNYLRASRSHRQSFSSTPSCFGVALMVPARHGGPGPRGNIRRVEGRVWFIYGSWRAASLRCCGGRTELCPLAGRAPVPAPRRGEPQRGDSAARYRWFIYGSGNLLARVQCGVARPRKLPSPFSRG